MNLRSITAKQEFPDCVPRLESPHTLGVGTKAMHFKQAIFSNMCTDIITI